MSTSVEQQIRSLTDAQRFAAIIEYSDDAIISKDLNGIITTWNPGAERIFGYSAEEVIGKPITILIPPDRQDEEPFILNQIRRGERVDHYETVRRRKDGTYIDISLTVSPIKDVQGNITGASKIARDITERKRTDAQIATLAREAEHRAKNLLAVVQAVVSLSQSSTPEGLKASIDGRIRALAHVHDLFVQSRWAGANLRHLVEEELSPYLRTGRHMGLEGPVVLLQREVAQTVAVAVHELATNAAKYGALSQEQGHVDVAWSQTEDGSLIIRWTESGGPHVYTPSRGGFGTRVINSMMQAINGKVHFNWRPEGLDCRIVLPAYGESQTDETGKGGPPQNKPPCAERFGQEAFTSVPANKV
jgi:PAS domain S-box-containing protein